MRDRFFSVAMALLLGLALAPFAYAADYHVKPGLFIGTVANCGVAGSRIVGADWVKDFGLPDDHGHDNQALMLSKNGLTTDCSAAFATIEGTGKSPIIEITLTELGYDIRNGGHCGAGSPRFNVETTDGFWFVGCSSPPPAAAPVPGNAAWQRLRWSGPLMGFNSAIDPIDASPVTGTLKSLSIAFDEGTDTGPDFSGFVMLDNIDINGTLVTRQ
jgi:hypothetical protein